MLRRRSLQSTHRVLLEAAYFVPMAIARTAKRLNLRTEASARFERGCDPNGIDRAADRFCQLLAAMAGPAFAVAPGVIDVRGAVPEPTRLTVRTDRINALLGTAFGPKEVTELLAPLEITAEPGREPGVLDVTVPTFRPDIRPEPLGEADIAEEVARTFGYSRLARREPAWPQPGGLTRRQRERRVVKEVLCGLGASEAWTPSIVTEWDETMSGMSGPWIEVANPLVSDERFLRASMLPGLLRALAYNADRRQGALRLFEVGTVFGMLEDAPLDPKDGPVADEHERLSVVFAADGDDARSAVAAWSVLAETLRIDGIALVPIQGGFGGVHPSRHASLVNRAGLSAGPRSSDDRSPQQDVVATIGEVGEVSPHTVEQFGLVDRDGKPRRIGWLDIDLGYLLDPAVVSRRPDEARPPSRFPSSDIDLAFVVADDVVAGEVTETLAHVGGALLESVELFDVYRGASIPSGTRSLAYHLRFCALDRTLTDEEVGAERARCIEAVESQFGARLR